MFLMRTSWFFSKRSVLIESYLKQTHLKKIWRSFNEIFIMRAVTKWENPELAQKHQRNKVHEQYNSLANTNSINFGWRNCPRKISLFCQLHLWAGWNSSHYRHQTDKTCKYSSRQARGRINIPSDCTVTSKPLLCERLLTGIMHACACACHFQRLPARDHGSFRRFSVVEAKYDRSSQTSFISASTVLTSDRSGRTGTTYVQRSGEKANYCFLTSQF